MKRRIGWNDLAAATTARQWRLHACAFARRWVGQTVPAYRSSLEIAERYADGEAKKTELARARVFAQSLTPASLQTPGSSPLLSRQYAVDAIDELRDALAERPGRRRPPTDWRDMLGTGPHQRFFNRLLFEIVGNPDPPPVFAPEWRTSTAVAIAKGMYESRDFAAMPILADALQDAGRDSDDVLNHCRDESQVHVRGCWVVDLVLGKT
jgi:hypothetical protein